MYDWGIPEIAEHHTPPEKDAIRQQGQMQPGSKRRELRQAARFRDQTDAENAST